CAGCHRQQQLALCADDGLLRSDDAAPLVVAESSNDVRRRVQEPIARGFKVKREKRLKRRCGVKVTDPDRRSIRCRRDRWWSCYLVRITYGLAGLRVQSPSV